MYLASDVDTSSSSTRISADTGTPYWCGTSVGAPPRVLLILAYSTGNGVRALIRMMILDCNSSPGSPINEPKARIPIFFFGWRQLGSAGDGSRCVRYGL